MHVRVDDKEDAHAGLVGRAQVWFYLTNRIDDGAARASAATEQVRDRNGVGVQKLTEDHPSLSCRGDRKLDHPSFIQSIL
jgi:hypothetical protein